MSLVLADDEIQQYARCVLSGTTASCKMFWRARIAFSMEQRYHVIIETYRIVPDHHRLEYQRLERISNSLYDLYMRLERMENETNE